jgi:CTP synthase
MERHRHRYEVNDGYIQQLIEAGLKVVGKSMDGMLVEVIEVPDHPWFVGCQFHPEFTSTPRQGHPLFIGFVNAAIEHSNQQAAFTEGGDVESGSQSGENSAVAEIKSAQA